jgi:two-component system response regulator HydG
VNERRKRVLIVDDDPSDLEVIAESLEREGYEIVKASSGRSALEIIRSEDFDLIVTDLKLPDLDGMEILRRAKEEIPYVQVIVLTGYGTVEGAVEAMQSGAFHFLQKPIDIHILRETARRAIEKRDLELENLRLKEQVERRYRFENIIGKSSQMQEIFRQIRRVAPTKASVLIVGETGTGKELIARAIHQNSPRKDKPFIAVNCAAIPRDLLESELFGHEKGAFTGAIRQRTGYFELADGGTLFLDEIGEMSLEVQAKLLRAIETHEFWRVGGSRSMKVDVRIISATNKDLEETVREGRFREDLYYRLKVFTIKIPPLRQRREDIPLLVQHFIQEICKQNNRPPLNITREAMDNLVRYDWPGNVRQLRNVIESVIITTTSDTIRPEDLPEEIKGATTTDEEESDRIDVRVGMSMEDIEREAIKRTLMETRGNKTKAASILKIGLRTLYRKIKQYGLEDLS